MSHSGRRRSQSARLSLYEGRLERAGNLILLEMITLISDNRIQILGPSASCRSSGGTGSTLVSAALNAADAVLPLAKNTAES